MCRFCLQALLREELRLPVSDADLLLDLQKDGINIYFQTTPDYPSETLDKAVAKL